MIFYSFVSQLKLKRLICEFLILGLKSPVRRVAQHPFLFGYDFILFSGPIILILTLIDDIILMEDFVLMYNCVLVKL